MKHPTQEFWMASLYGELSAAEQKEAEAHLAECSHCRETLTQWRQTMAVLDTDRNPVQPPKSWRWQSMVPWAVAASLTFLVGFVAGRSAGPSRQELAEELRTARESIATELREQYRSDLAAVAQAAVAASGSENRGLVTQVMDQFNEARVTDRREWLASLERLERRRDRQFDALRAGLLDLAQHTRAGFQQTEQNLNVLANYLPPSENHPANPAEDSSLESTP